jgi:hypothetical protein
MQYPTTPLSYSAARVSGYAVLASEINQDTLPVTIETPCLTLSGSGEWATCLTQQLGTVHTISATITLGSTADQAIVSGNGSGGSYFLFLSGGLYYACSGSFVGVSITMTAGSTKTYTVVRSGTSVKFFVDGVQVGATQTLGANSQFGQIVQVGRHITSFLLNGRIDNIRVYSVAKSDAEVAVIADDLIDDRVGLENHWTCQDGAGDGTNRTIFCAQGSGRNLTTVGTVANHWSNRRNGFRKDWCVQYGGVLNGNGAFVPGIPGLGYAANGAIKNLVGHKNPASRMNRDPLTAAEFVGRSVDTALAPDAASTITPSDSAFDNGSSIYFIAESALTGSDLINANEFVASVAGVTARSITNTQLVRGFTTSDFFAGIAGQGQTTIGTMRVIAKVLSVPADFNNGPTFLAGLVNGTDGYGLATAGSANGLQALQNGVYSAGFAITSGNIGDCVVCYVVYNGTQIQLYIGGFIIGGTTATATAAPTTNGFTIGNHPTLDQHADSFAIVDVAMSRVIMTGEQIYNQVHDIQSRATIIAEDLPRQTHRWNADDLANPLTWVDRVAGLVLNGSASLIVEAV